MVLMSVFDILSSNIWLIFLFFTLIYPRMQQSLIQSARIKTLKSLGQKRGSNVITLIHRQETLSLFGLPIARYIDIEDSENVLRAIRMTPSDQPIDLVIHTPGGIALAATQIAFALKSHNGRTTVMVPHYAMSGGTLIALAADEVLMDAQAVLGPVDPQLVTQRGQYAAPSLLKVLEKKKPDEIDDETFYLAEEARKAVDQIREIVEELVTDKYSMDQVESIIDSLVMGKYTHDYPLTASKVCELLGQCAVPELPSEVYALMNYYKMGKQQRPGVEYVPVSQGKEGA